MEPVHVRAEPTPNPNAMKFSVNRTVVTGGRGITFSGATEAFATPLARRICAIPGVAAVFLLKDFVTVTRAEGADWDLIVPPVEQILEQELSEA